MQTIPLSAVPSQTVSVVLGGQNCRIAVYQKSTGMYCDLYNGDDPVFTTVAALNAVPMKQGAYLPFLGDLVFVDSEGASDPDYTGLGPGGRFALAYLTAAELGQ